MEKIDELIELSEYMKTSEYLNDNEKNRRLLYYYPWMEPRDIWGNKITLKEMEKEGQIWTAWIDFPLGWRKAFGWDMLRELGETIVHDRLENFTILQIKEKFGGLRFYCYGANEKVHEIIRKYEELSEKTCIECGKPAKWMSTGWISPYCDDCKERFMKESVPLYMDMGEFCEIKENEN